MNVTVNCNNTNVQITLAQQFKILNDRDCLPHLALKKATLQVESELDLVLNDE